MDLATSDPVIAERSASAGKSFDAKDKLRSSFVFAVNRVLNTLETVAHQAGAQNYM